jgi:hypothetical protein
MASASVKPKSLLPAAVLAVFAAIPWWSRVGNAQTVQYVTLNGTASPVALQYPLQTNQIISFVGYDWSHSPQVLGKFPDGTTVTLAPLGNPTNSNYYASQIPQMVTGLTNVFINPFVVGWVTLQIITPASTTVVSNYVPADAIVIPASATGNVQVILESSTDLLNWTAANPGTYGPSAATNRFFRVRAVAN